MTERDRSLSLTSFTLWHDMNFLQQQVGAGLEHTVNVVTEVELLLQSVNVIDHLRKGSG